MRLYKMRFILILNFNWFIFCSSSTWNSLNSSGSIFSNINIFSLWPFLSKFKSSNLCFFGVILVLPSYIGIQTRNHFDLFLYKNITIYFYPSKISFKAWLSITGVARLFFSGAIFSNFECSWGRKFFSKHETDI